MTVYLPTASRNAADKLSGESAITLARGQYSLTAGSMFFSAQGKCIKNNPVDIPQTPGVILLLLETFALYWQSLKLRDVLFVTS